MESSLRQNAPAGFRDRVMAGLPPALGSSQPSVARVDAVLGEVAISCAGGKDAPVFEEMAIKRGDRLRLGPGALALLTLADGSQVYLNSGAEIRFPAQSDHELRLSAGQLFASMRRQAEPFVVRTPSAALSVLGTEFDAKVTGERTTRLQVFKGAVEFRNGAGAAIVRSRQQAEAPGHQRPVAQRMTSGGGGDGSGAWRRPLARPTSSRQKHNGNWNPFMKRIVIGMILIALVAWAAWHAWTTLPQNRFRPAPTSAMATNAKATSATAPAASATESAAWAEDPRHWELNTGMLRKAPKLFVFRPTRFQESQNGSAWVSGETNEGSCFIGENMALKELIGKAHGFPDYRMEFPGGMPTGSYDVLINRMGIEEVLKKEIERRFSSSTRVEKRLKDAYLMKLVNPGAPGVKPPLKGGGRFDANGAKIEWQFSSASFSKICKNIENMMSAPVIDKTGDSAEHAMTLSWSSWNNKDAFRRALREQLGVELVPAKDEVDVLVVTFAAPSQNPGAATPAVPDASQWR
jgi:uncharacterized protein (TIGR03435 family)